MATKLLNLALYQLGWFSCVLGGAVGHPFIGAFFALFLLAAHLWLACDRTAEVRMVAGCILLGVSVDTLQQGLGVFSYRTDPAWPLWLPLWAFLLWGQFATLFHYALRWLSGRYLLASLLGMAGGPLAYAGGIRMGAASFGEDPLRSLAILALVWGGVTPLLLLLSDRTAKCAGRYRLLRDCGSSAEPSADQKAPERNDGAEEGPPGDVDDHDLEGPLP